MSYSRPQLKLLLLLVAIFLAGLGVREWRMGFPDAAERLERFDREDPPPPIPPAPRSRAAPRWAVARPEPAAPPRALQPPRTRVRSTSTGPARTRSPGSPASARAWLAASSRSAIGAGASNRLTACGASWAWAQRNSPRFVST